MDKYDSSHSHFNSMKSNEIPQMDNRGISTLYYYILGLRWIIFNNPLSEIMKLKEKIRLLKKKGELLNWSLPLLS